MCCISAVVETNKSYSFVPGFKYTPVYGIPLLGHNTMHSFFKTLEEVYSSVKNTNKTLEKERSRNVVKALIINAVESHLLLRRTKCL